MDPHIVVDHSRDLIDYLTLAIGGIGLVALVTYTVLTYRLLKTTRATLAQTCRSNEATEESNRIAKASLEIGNRAWLVVTFKDHPGSDSRDIVMENIGRAPATDVTIWHHFDLWPGPVLPDEIAPMTEPDVGIIIGAGRTHILASDPWAPNSDEEIERIERNQAVRFFYCQVDYRDIFDTPRKTMACWQFCPDRSGEFDWILAPKLNRMD